MFHQANSRVHQGFLWGTRHLALGLQLTCSVMQLFQSSLKSYLCSWTSVSIAPDKYDMIKSLASGNWLMSESSPHRAISKDSWMENGFTRNVHESCLQKSNTRIQQLKLSNLPILSYFSLRLTVCFPSNSCTCKNRWQDAKTQTQTRNEGNKNEEE